jgi:hypothetical protein
VIEEAARLAHVARNGVGVGVFDGVHGAAYVIAKGACAREFAAAPAVGDFGQDQRVKVEPVFADIGRGGHGLGANVGAGCAAAAKGQAVV